MDIIVKNESFLKSRLINVILSTSIIGALGFNYAIYDSRPPIYISHILMTAMFLSTLLLFVLSKFSLKSKYQIVIIIFPVVFSLSGFNYTRFLNEFVKFIYIILLYYMFLQIFYKFEINTKLIAFSFLIGLLISTITVNSLYRIPVYNNLFDYQQVLATYNSYAFMLGSCLILCAYLFTVCRAFYERVFVAMASIYLLIVFMTTFSRGGLVSLIIGLMVYFISSSRVKSRLKNYIYSIIFTTVGIVIILILAILLLKEYSESVQEIRNMFMLFIGRFEDHTGTGRIELWPFLIADLFNNPLYLLIGKGLGSLDSVSFNISFDYDFSSAHSLYVETMYQFGLFILMGLLLFFFRTLRGLLLLPLSYERCLMIAIFLQIAVGSIFDSYHGSSQIGWCFGFWFGMFWASIIGWRDMKLMWR